jgi:hypothetical protein
VTCENSHTQASPPRSHHASRWGFMLDAIVVVDCVAHAFDMSPANWADARFAEPANAQVAGLLSSGPRGYRLD